MHKEMTPSRIEQAARNNAIWCDTICRAHGIPGEVQDYLWLNRHQVPRFYPNAVTLSQTQGVAEQLAQIQDMNAEGIPGNWAVKDSFCILDLAPLAFQPLFEATWLWRAPSLPKPKVVGVGIHWATVQEPSELSRWETAWNGLPADDRSAPPARIFLPSLLADKDVAFITAYRDEHIIAGAVANRTGDVVGLSNVFVPGDDAPRFWAGCLTAAMDAFPGLPLVGYERGSELAVAQTLGFEGIGSLRVWRRMGSADEQKPAVAGTVEAWARSPNNPVGGWYGLKKGLRGRFGMYVPPVVAVLGLAEVEHNPKNNRMRAK